MGTSVVYRCEPSNGGGFLARFFPTPKLLLPRAAGLDISDSSIKWLELKPASRGFEVETFAFADLEPGLVVEGIVRDEEKLGKAIRALREAAHGGHFVHLALPEEAAFIFTMHVANAGERPQVLRMIEFELEDHVPLPPESVVYDYDVVGVHKDDEGAEISVSAFPQKIIDGYIGALSLAGVTPLSFEIEMASIGRSVLTPHVHEVVLVIDFGRARTGIGIVKNGMPIFTSTVMIGGDAMTKVIMDTLKVDAAKAEEFKNEQGIAKDADPTVAGTAGALADEIARHFEYWDTRRDTHGNRVTPVSRVVLTGGSSNLKGLDEHIAGRVRAPTVRANVWQNVCSFDDYVPSIDAHHSLGLSTAIGLALRGV